MAQRHEPPELKEGENFVVAARRDGSARGPRGGLRDIRRMGELRLDAALPYLLSGR